LPKGDEGNLSKLSATLEFSERLLPPEAHPTHRVRLRLIGDILRTRSEQLDFAYPEPPPTGPLQWQQVGGTYRALTYYGIAAIRETRQGQATFHTVGGVTSYEPRLEDASGVSLRGYRNRHF